MVPHGVIPHVAQAGPRTGPARNVPLWLLLVLALGLAAKAPELALPMGPDQGTYAYVAERILAGGLPYVDAFDNKPPGTYYLHALVLALVPASLRWGQSCVPGIFQPCGYVALQLLDVAWTAATVAALFVLGRALGGSARVGWLAAGVAAVFLNLSQLSREGSTPEKQLLLPMALAYLAWLRGRRSGRGRWLVLAGIGVGLAFLLKQTAVSIVLALVLWEAHTLVRYRGWSPSAPGSTPRSPRETGGQTKPADADARRREVLSGSVERIRAFALLGLGAALPLAVAAAVFGAMGSLGALWEASFAYNAAQAAASPPQLLYAFLRGAWQVFSQSSALLWVLAAAGALRVALGRGTPLVWWLAVTWAVADVLALFLGGTKFAQVYFVQVVPACALLAALALDAAWERTVGSPAARASLALAGLALLVLSNPLQVSVLLRVWYQRLPGRVVESAEQAVANALPAFDRFRAERTLYVWGDAAQVYVLSGARAPSRFFHPYPVSTVFVRDGGTASRRAELVRALEAAPPAVIAYDPRAERDDPTGSEGLNPATFPELRALVERAYTRAENAPAGWTLYLRATPGGP